MERLLWTKDHRLSNEDLTIIARALRIPGVEDMNIQLIQKEIERVCKSNPQRFLNLKKLDKETEMRADIQNAVEKGILNFDSKPNKRKWSMTDGGNTAELCSARKTDDPVSSLVFFLKNNDSNDHHGRIKELIVETKKATVKAK